MTDQMKPVTKVGASLSGKINVGDFQNVEIGFWVEDYVRDSDANTAAALDRVYALVDAKVDEKAKEYKK
jgi:hypothetical protein